MYRIIKVLNHNAVLAVAEGGSTEFLLMGKGIGFGKHVSERINVSEDCTKYELKEDTGRGASRQLIKELAPAYLDIADTILNEAEREFGTIDRNILFPMADHISFAVKRLKAGETISNPLTQDIQVLFYKEYKIAELSQKLVWELEQVFVNEDEIGYIALHVHSAICDEKVSSAMQVAGAVRMCITLIEQEMGISLGVQTLSYNRLMNHIKYMAARAWSGEELKLNMNDYVRLQFPKSYQIAQAVCSQMARQLKADLPEIEVGYLAIHIERVYAEIE